MKIYDGLIKAGFQVWLDRAEGINSNMNMDMAAAVENAYLIMPFLSSAYLQSANCEKELSYADKLQIPMIPILLEPSFDANSWLGLIVSRWKYLDFTTVDSDRVPIDTIVRHINLLKQNGAKPDKKNMVKILYDFDATKPNELSVKAAEEYELVGDKTDWIWIKSGTKEGLVPSNYVAYKDEGTKFVMSQYHFIDLTPEKADEYISWAPEGSFLICNATPLDFPIQYFLLVKTKSIIWKVGRTGSLILHLSIRNIANEFVIDMNPVRRFSNVEKLVTFCVQTGIVYKKLRSGFDKPDGGDDDQFVVLTAPMRKEIIALKNQHDERTERSKMLQEKHKQLISNIKSLTQPN